jgi:Rad3-related DNA helicase
MWSLYKRKEGEDPLETLGENLFACSGEPLEPLKFSNNKTQADVVKEVLDAIEAGNKIIFIKGVCGTGKSAIALNLARHFKKTSIVVPIKSLQQQYEQDYTKKMFIQKKDKQKLNIAVIKGRNNFSCPYMGGTADGENLPCTIELREKNMEQIKKYIEKNDHVSKFDFQTVSDVRRMSVAPSCPYWSPLLPSEVSSKSLEKAHKKSYPTVSGKDFALFHRKKGCAYNDQYTSYADADVLIFNSMKYLIETSIGRKPKTDLDIIDECDEFLDNFANEKRINLNRLVSALSSLFPETREKKLAIKDLIFLANEVIFDAPENIQQSQFKESEPIKVASTKMLPLIQKIIENPYLAEDEENNYYNYAFETAKSFEHLIPETYVSFEKVSEQQNIPDQNQRQTGIFGEPKIKSPQQDTVFASLVSINLAQKFREIIDANNILVLMSGTLHSEKILRDIFGLKEFKTIEAELEMPGTITKYRTGLEKNCKYANFQSGQVTRRQYLKALSCCIKNAEEPTLVHVSSFGDLPSEIEKQEYDIDNVPSKEELKQMQNNKNSKNPVDKFTSGEIDLLFTTKCSRGVDFPGDKCKSIILTKYPYPNISSLFWKILKKEQPDKFMDFYLDKAKRELIQKIARGVRFKGDHVLLLSPDERILNAWLK